MAARKSWKPYREVVVPPSAGAEGGPADLSACWIAHAIADAVVRSHADELADWLRSQGAHPAGPV